MKYIQPDTFICGDCLEIMENIKSHSIDMILCDLPYGTTQCAWDVIIPFNDYVELDGKILYQKDFVEYCAMHQMDLTEGYQWFEQNKKTGLWSHYKRIIKNNGAIVLFGAEPFSSCLRLSNLEMFKYDWIWDKVKGTGFLNANRQPMRNHEILSVFYKKQCKYHPQMTHGHNLKKAFRSHECHTEVYGDVKNDYYYESTDRYPRSIQVFSCDTQNSSLHSTQKPLELCKYMIETYTDKGDVVLDNCAGSCTTGVAAHETGRKFIGIEKDKKIYDIGWKRWDNARKQRNLFEYGLNTKKQIEEKPVAPQNTQMTLFTVNHPLSMPDSVHA